MNTNHFTDATRGRCTSAVALLIVLTMFHWEPLSAQPQPPPPNWSGFQFLVGEWIGEGTGTPGEATGGFSFGYDLQKTVLVRKNFAEYPATKDRPAFSHNDLMILYQEGGKTRAIYFDNEQHVINYSVTLSKDASSIVFVSDPSPSAPRFRLTNTRDGAEKVKILFEMAPPGKPDAFTKYIEASARRKK